MKAFRNIRLVAKNGVLQGKALLFDEKIIDIVDEKDIPGEAEIIEGNNSYLTSGFINVHIHGCNGYDTMDESSNALENIAESLLKTGVTSFLPTTMTMSFETIEKSLEAIRNFMKNSEYSEVLGCHLEGPFISKKYKGAQNEDYIIEPDFEKISSFTDVIKIVTVAPEVTGGLEFIKECVKNKIIVSIGHSNAEYEDALKAIEAGASHITHTFSAMTPLNHRKPGVVGAAFTTNVTCELIADNLHVNPVVQRIMLDIKGKDKIILITDSMRACLLQDGEYDLGGQLVHVRGNAARLEDGTIAGSVLALNNGIKNFMDNTGIKIWEAVNMASLNPAVLLGVDHRKGSLERGKDADLVLLDEDFNVKMTFVKGRGLYSGE